MQLPSSKTVGLLKVTEERKTEYEEESKDIEKDLDNFLLGDKNA